MPLGHTITIDGLLADWLSTDRIDDGSIAGYRINGTSDATYFYFSITAPIAIGANTTVWLNTDRNAATGYQIFGNSGGAEYNINFAANGTVSLYSGAAGQTLVASGLTAVWSADQKTVEFRIPKATIGNPIAIDTLYDINDSLFLPTSYALKPYTLFNDTGIVPAADKRIGLVYSDTTAAAYFSTTGYSQLFMAAQSQIMQSGLPYDILGESDLTNLTTLAKYDVLVFPSFRNVQASQVTAITNTLEQATKQFGIGLIVGGEFMVVDAAGAALPGDSYARMKSLLDVTRVTGGNGTITLTATDQAGQQWSNYYYHNGDVIETYTNSGTGWNTFNSVSGTGIVLANETINGSSVYPAVIATQTGGRNTHFATEAYLADSNMLQAAINQSVTNNILTAGLQMTRNTGIVATRVDMDQSQEIVEVNPDGNAPGIYDLFVPIVTGWKQNYNFVASYYVNVGNNPPDQTTDWAVSLPYYKALIDLGGEIGSHSYTHPDNTNLLNASQIQFEFGNSQTVLEQQLSAYLGRTYNLTGAAVPGAPETLTTSLAILPYVDQYLSGGFSGEGAGYPNAFGFLTPQQQSKVYLAPNATFDFTLMEWLRLTIPQAEAYWAAEWDDTAIRADSPIIVWPIHDYAVTQWNTGTPSPYQTSMFTNWIARAYDEGSEFVTLTDLASRISAMKAATLTTSVSGNTITATVTASNVGTFALDVDNQGGMLIKNVQGWYAYNEGAVFLPASGGTFTVNMGAAQDDLTHITELPMRASLLSLTGNGQNLSFSVAGEGRVVIDLKAPGAATINVTGATVVSQVGEILTLDLGANGTHNVSVTYSTPASTNIVSNGAGDTAALTIAENGTAVTTVAGVPGVLGSAVTYSISGGADAAKFTINSTTGVLAFLAAPNFEAPTDAGANNVYDVIVQATSGSTSDTQAIAVTVTNVNEAPVITSNGGGDTAAVSMQENGTAVTTVTSTDPENTARSYSILGGADAAKFTINATTGALTFLVAPDFEAPTDAGANNIYDVIVQASDGLLSDTQAIAVTVTDGPDLTRITSNGGGDTAALSIAENGTAVTTVAAIAGVTGAAVQYSISGGADAAKFTINATTGVLAFLAAPNFEAPTDAGANNVYDVTVQASDGSTVDTQAIAVTVTDAAEVTITSNGGGDTASINVAENGTAVTTVAATGTTGIQYSLAAGGDSARFTINSSTGVLTFVAPPDFETPTDSDLNNSYLVTVVASAGAIQDTQALTVNVTNVAGITASSAGGNTLNGTGEEDILTGNGQNNVINGLGGNDTISGNGANDTLNGGDGNDSINGNAGDDTIDGGAGNDTITGGNGRDVMTGGTGVDTFIFTANGQSTTNAATRDIITDFLAGTDRIDLSGIDANSNTGGNQAFTFIGTAAFTAVGQIRYTTEVVGGTTYTVIQTNTGGSLAADFTVALVGTHVLTAADFVL